MTLSEDELEAIRRELMHGRYDFATCADLFDEVRRLLDAELLEVTATADRLQEERDRLRHLDKLAREWLKASDNVIAFCDDDHDSRVAAQDAREAYREAAEEKP